MATILFKWFMAFSLLGLSSAHHPIFVSVTQIEQVAADQTLEISCKIFTDDLEQALKQQSKTRIDLLHPADKGLMNTLVNHYIQQHLQIKVDGKSCAMEFIGYEQQEEGIISYFQVNKIVSVKNLAVSNTILYESKPQQMQIIHATANGVRKSSRLNNPDAVANFVFGPL